jgi:hypothetical protein
VTDRLPDCALAVFARKGFHETSIADICAPARIARGTLYSIRPGVEEPLRLNRWLGFRFTPPDGELEDR